MANMLSKTMIALVLVALVAVPVSAATCPGFVVSDDFARSTGLSMGGNYLKIHEYPLGVSHNEYTKAMMARYICGLTIRMQTGRDEVEILDVTVTEAGAGVKIYKDYNPARELTDIPEIEIP